MAPVALARLSTQSMLCCNDECRSCRSNCPSRTYRFRQTEKTQTKQTSADEVKRLRNAKVALKNTFSTQNAREVVRRWLMFLHVLQILTCLIAACVILNKPKHTTEFDLACIFAALTCSHLAHLSLTYLRPPVRHVPMRGTLGKGKRL